MRNLLLPLLILILVLTGCSKSIESSTNFTKTKENVNSPYEGYTIREWEFIAFNLLDRRQIDSKDQYETCEENRSLRGNEDCPTFNIVSFSPTDGNLMEDELYPIDVELFDEMDKDYIDLWCYIPESGQWPAVIYTDSFDEKLKDSKNYTIMDSNTENTIIKLIDSQVSVKVKLTKQPYNIQEDHSWWGCESVINKIEIIK
jgi:uncharacterized protein YceK